MIPQEMQDLLTQRNTAIVAINRRSGGPQLSPVWYLWDGEVFYFRVARNTAKYANLKRNPSISLIVNDITGFRYITVYGQAEIIEADSADVSARIASRYYAPEMAKQIISQPLEPGAVTVRVRPEKVVAVIEDIAREAANSWSQ